MSAAILADAGFLSLPSELPLVMLEALPIDDAIPAGAIGSRNLLCENWCAALVAPIRAQLRARCLLSADAVAVQCTMFRKTADCNWKVPYHQDLSIPVAKRVDGTGISGWSMKEDGHYVQPDGALLECLLAVRLHLDACGEDEGAMRVVSGSHRLGRLSPGHISALDKVRGEYVCKAERGDLLLMRPLLLHASSKAKRPNGRRVLHFVFAPPDPGRGLQWRIAV